MKSILFLCTGNSCRSQMAEGWGKSLLGSNYSVYSAGTKKHGLNELAVKVMDEVGIDISSHYSKTLDDLKDVNFDVIFTVCSNAHETCPVFPGGKISHVGFDDPPYLAKTVDSEEAILLIYRRVRDEIKAFVESIPSTVDTLGVN
ncbi:arsenate reductase ArsC [bacterium]|jgi:arsenate reductase (thioredoxin)|nr:arsenate reductase ArsC [bacterium]